VEGILALVNGKGDVFTFVNAATAMNTLQKVAKRGKGEREWKLEGKRLSEDPRFARLIDSVRVHCPRFRAFEGANVLHALGVLQADLGALAVDEKLAAHMGEVIEREARAMIPQAVSNTLNALSKQPQQLQHVYCLGVDHLGLFRLRPHACCSEAYGFCHARVNPLQQCRVVFREGPHFSVVQEYGQHES